MKVFLVKIYNNLKLKLFFLWHGFGYIKYNPGRIVSFFYSGCTPKWLKRNFTDIYD